MLPLSLYKCGNCGSTYVNLVGTVVRCSFCNSKERDEIATLDIEDIKVVFEKLLNDPKTKKITLTHIKEAVAENNCF